MTTVTMSSASTRVLMTSRMEVRTNIVVSYTALGAHAARQLRCDRRQRVAHAPARPAAHWPGAPFCMARNTEWRPLQVTPKS